MHDHAPTAGTLDRTAARSRLGVSLAVNLTIVTVEIVGGIISGSLALLADSAHMLTDSIGLTLALVAATLAMRPATKKRTFGWKRAEILAASINGLLMLGVSIFVAVEGIERVVTPPEVDAPIMLIAAVVGLLANVVVMSLLVRHAKDSLNIRGAYLEVWGDAVGSVLVILSGIVIMLTGFTRADGIASLIIACLIFPRAIVLLRAAVRVLLEATPEGVDVEKLRTHLSGIPGVVQIHDLHVWTITSGMPSLTVHAQIDPRYAAELSSGAMLRAFQRCTQEHFDLKHSTFQFEIGSAVNSQDACDAE
ncbi:MAG TPA: cation transporter, partial [Pseudoclavibacter sp.]|nr:cation transporter [Pseudoclavibacter sp.]